MLRVSAVVLVGSASRSEFAVVLHMKSITARLHGWNRWWYSSGQLQLISLCQVAVTVCNAFANQFALLQMQLCYDTCACQDRSE